MEELFWKSPKAARSDFGEGGRIKFKASILLLVIQDKESLSFWKNFGEKIAEIARKFVNFEKPTS